MNKNKLIAVVAFFGLLILIFFRENLLLEINAFLAQKEYNRAFTFWFADYFETLPTHNLVKWKWGVSLSFTFSIVLLTLLSLHFWFKNIEFTKLVIKAYAFVAVILVLIGVAFYLFNSFNDIYPLLRRAFGVIHSPIPFFILFLLFYKDQSINKN